MTIKRVAIIITLIFSMCTVFGQDTLNRTDAQGKKIGYWKKIENGKLIYEGRFNKDVPVGEFTYYHSDGSRKSISNFLNGTHRVQCSLFHKNGQKSAEGIFIDQRKDGEWRYYSNAGKLVKIEGYKNGTPDGDWKTYSSQTGILLLEEAYRDGVLHGEQKEYYTTGDIKSSTPYINGKRNGMTETYYVGNIPASRGIFHQNVQTGTWEFYDSRGKLRKNVEYVKGLEKTVYLIFYNGSAPQKLNQNIVTFIKKNNNGIDVIVKNGNKIRCTDDFYETSLWLDQLVILQVTPTLMVAYDAIKGYRVVETEEEEWEEEPDELESIISELIEDPLNANANEIVAKETLLLVTDPPYEHDIIVKGRFAAMIKSLCNTAVPVQE